MNSVSEEGTEENRRKFGTNDSRKRYDYKESCDLFSLEEKELMALRVGEP